jgi:hypothetical protein
MLREVEWGEYRLGDLFDHIEQGRRLTKNDQQPGDIPFVMAGATNTGVVGYISNPVAKFPRNSITVDILGNTFYRSFSFGAGDDTGVYWNESKPYSEAVMLYIAAAIGKALTGRYNFGYKLRSSKSHDIKVQLPVLNGEINFSFMEKFIAELEAQHIAELEAYLVAAELKDYTLTSEEIQAVQDYEKLEWKSYNLEELFGKSTRGKRLKSDDRISGPLPFVTAGEANEGVSAFIGNGVDIFSKNTITIDMFGSAKYRNYDYGGDDHIAVVHTERLSKHASIFVTSAIHKSSHNGQFDYGNNFYAKDADALDIMLPVKNGEIAYSYMETLISAMHKLVIKDIVQFADREMAATVYQVNQDQSSYCTTTEKIERQGTTTE